MKNIALIFFMILSAATFGQPFDETLLSRNFPDPEYIKTTDLDGNGTTDMVVAGSTGIVWFSNQSGTFSRMEWIWELDDISGIEPLDYDNDGDIDIVAASYSQSLLCWLENNGSESFSMHVISDTIEFIEAIYAGDAENDGDVDVFYTLYNGGYQDLYLYAKTLSGFTNTYIDRGDYGEGIFGCDFGSDGDLDIVTVENYSPYNTEELYVLLNNGSNVFTGLKFYETDNIMLSDFQYVDVDKDGNKDLVVSNYTDNEIYWIRAGYSGRKDIKNGHPVRDVNVADYDGDGINDVIYKLASSPYNFYFLKGANPGSSMTFTEAGLYAAGGFTYAAENLQIDADGRMDFAYLVPGRDQVVTMQNQGSFIFTPALQTSDIRDPKWLRRADLDLDGDMDLLCFESTTGLIWFDNQDDGTFEPRIISTNISSPKQLEVTDIDGDNDMDIVTASISDDDFVCWLNNGDQTFNRLAITSLSSQIANPSYFCIEDLDKDGDNDFCIIGSALDMGSPVGIFWIRNNGGGSFSSPITIQSGLEMLQHMVGNDFDGDGDVDMVVTGSMSLEGLRLVRNNGGGSFTEMALNSSLSCDWMRKADMDGDSDMDFIVRSDANQFIWHENTGGLNFTPHTITTGESDVAYFEPYDFGNDGDMDLFFFTTYSGTTNDKRFKAGVFENDGSENFTKIILLQDQYYITAGLPVDEDLDDDMDMYLGIGYANKMSYFKNQLNNLAEPTVTSWPTASAITYGSALGASTLSGGSGSVPGTFAFKNPALIPNVGAYSATVVFSPTDDQTYAKVEGSVSVTVNKATPTVSTWPSASAITFGNSVSTSVLSGGSASTSGTFTFSNGTHIPGTGTYIAPVVFTPSNTDNYNTVNGTVPVTVNKANPVISAWPAASAITYGNQVSTSALAGGTASVAGTFAFTNGTVVPSAGTYAAGVTFTPADAVNYYAISGTTSITVNKATPAVSAWPAASGITYGNTVGTSVLTGGTASVAGSFTFTNPTVQPNAGNYSAAATFNPTDNANYNSVNGNVTVPVSKATPAVTAWPVATAIVYGNALSASSLSGGAASIAGSFGFTNISTVPNAGTYSAAVTFSPSDAANYNNASGSTSVVVSKATPVITAWPATTNITYGDAVSSSVLSGGSSSVLGSFSFTNGSIHPAAGNYSAGVLFSPTDAFNYSTTSGSVTITVDKAIPVINAWPSASSIVYGSNLSASSLAGGNASVPGSFVFTNSSEMPLAGNYNAHITFTPSDASNYNNVTGTTNMVVTKASPVILAWPSASDITFGSILGSSILNGGNASTTGSFTFLNSTVSPDAGIFNAGVIFNPIDQNNYTTVSGSIDVVVDKADPVVTSWPVSSAITYGDQLNQSSLTGGSASIAGAFEFSDGSVVPDAGSFIAIVRFVPEDKGNYNTLEGNATVQVGKAIPLVINWPEAGDIFYGDQLDASLLTNGLANVPGMFVFTDADQTPVPGLFTASVEFMPEDDDNYENIEGSVNVTVNMANPMVSEWPQASGIIYGEPLSASILSGGQAMVSGTFSFDSGSTKPDAGTFPAEVIFTPDDGDNYAVITGSVNVIVARASQTIIWLQEFTDLEQDMEISLTAVSSSGLPVSYSADNSQVADINENFLTVTGPGNCTITASQEGNDNYLPAMEVTKTITYLATGVEESGSIGLLVYPVPARDYITIESNFDRIVSVVVINNAGIRLKEEFYDGVSRTELNLENLMPGTYHLIIRGEKSTRIRQIIKY